MHILILSLTSLSLTYFFGNIVSSAFFADMSKGDYSIYDIEDMEFNILQSLSWRIYAPTSIQIAHGILSLALPHHTHLKESTWGFF